MPPAPRRIADRTGFVRRSKIGSTRGNGCRSRSRTSLRSAATVSCSRFISAPGERQRDRGRDHGLQRLHVPRRQRDPHPALHGARARARGRRTDPRQRGGKAMSRFEDRDLRARSRARWRTASSARDPPGPGDHHVLDLGRGREPRAVPGDPVHAGGVRGRGAADRGRGRRDDPHPRAHARRRAELRGRGLPQHHRRDPVRGRRRDHQLLDRRGRRADREAASSTCASCGPRWAR